MKIHKIVPFIMAIAALAPSFRATAQTEPPGQRVPYLTAEEEAAKIQLPSGYSLELVVGDPIIKEPVMGVFDGDGRMFVAEMRTYMQDIDGNNELTRNGRVSLHWSSKHDGVFDKHTVFADHLLLPRMLLPYGDGVLVNETDSNDVWLFRDTDGDGVADKKELFYAGGPRGGNLEHQQSGLVWSLDNWMYMAVNSYRLRPSGGKVLREPTGPNGGQWGINQDNYGKLWFVNAGGEIGPLNFQEPIVYGSFSVRGETPPDFREVWPLVGLADVQGGVVRFRASDQTLNHFTATCGDEIFRGDRLPEDLRGDLVFGEPVGRLIRRAKVEVKDGITHLRNVYEKSEFIRATDPNFRPVNMMTAPDGTLYIVDMYRGIIQEGNWVRSDSYLRPMVQKYQLEKNFGRGRVWRLRHKDFQPGPQPSMIEETPAQLVAHLESPNGWWRDSAQHLLVWRGDKSVAPALTEMARSNPNPLARIHALWTLEGLGELHPAFLRVKLADANPRVRVAAIRASETLFKEGEKSLVPDLLALRKDPDPEVVIQLLMTARLLQWTDWKPLVETSIAATSSEGVREIGAQLLRPAASGGRSFTAAERKLLDHGEAIYKELCFTCHGPDGRGMPVQGGEPGATMAPPLVRSKTVMGIADGPIGVVLKGLNGPVNGKTYTAQMVAMESNNDEWIASVVSYVRNGFGNRASLVRPDMVARVRAAWKNRAAPWTPEELRAALPRPLSNRAQWKLTASHHQESARLAVDGDVGSRYDTGTSQVPGMWFQIELPSAATINGLELDAASSTDDYPRGYKVELSDDGQNWRPPVAVGRGESALTEIKFAPATAKFIRITQTGSVSGLFWSIHELQVFQPGAPLATTAAPASKPTSFE
jgi:mono/diheme cytochrome c family protein/glucose/arabinose dehydrogenase